MVKFPEKKKKDFDLSQVIYNILSFYKTPPKYSKNYMDAIVLKVDLGFLNKISDMEFMQHFFSKLDKFDFKPFSFKNSLST